MKFTRILLFLLVATLMACSEDSSSGKKSSSGYLLPSSNGAHTETLVVMTDQDWYGVPGEVFRKVFEEPIYGLPQTEATFKLLHVPPSKLTSLLKRTKSVILAERSDSSFFAHQTNKWANPQQVMVFQYASVRDFVEMLKRNKDFVFSQLRDTDLKLTEKTLARTAYKPLPKQLKELGISEMTLPKSFKNTVDKEWLKIYRAKTIKTDQSLIITTRPMLDEVVIGQDIINWRDSVGKNYYAGSREGSYMATEMLIAPTQRQFLKDDLLVIETRGLWRMEGDFMGGPFLSHTIYDDVHQRIITVEALIYGPEAKKRNIMFELEAMLQSVSLE